MEDFVFFSYFFVFPGFRGFWALYHPRGIVKKRTKKQGKSENKKSKEIERSKGWRDRACVAVKGSGVRFETVLDTFWTAGRKLQGDSLSGTEKRGFWQGGVSAVSSDQEALLLEGDILEGDI